MGPDSPDRLSRRRHWDGWVAVACLVALAAVASLVPGTPRGAPYRMAASPVAYLLEPSAGGGGGGRAAAPALADDFDPDAPRDAELLALVGQPARVAEGLAAYQDYCLSCHGAYEVVTRDNTALGGPSNLFDPIWHRGGTPAGIERSIRQGYGELGMPAWEGLATDAEVEAMVAYLLSLQARAGALASNP